jgi:hypothetical protein
LAAGINIGGHYKWHFFSFSPPPPGSLLILIEWVVVGLCNFAWAPSNKNIRIPTKKKKGDPLPPALCDFWAEKGGILSKGSKT